MEPSYRVETFTMPVNKLNDNEMDDVKFANKLKTNDDNIEKKISVISLIKDFESIVNKNEEINLPVFGEVKSSPSKKFVKKKETIVTVAPVTSSVSVNVVEENDVYKIEDKKDDQVKEINIKQSEKCEAEKINDNVLEHDENNIVEIQEDKYNEQSVDTVDAINEPIYDVPIPWHLRRPIFTNETLKKSEFINENSEKLIRTSSLMSIDELGESLIDDDNDDDNNDDNCNEFCCHGLKNGCTVIRQKPEQITEDIFKTNWLKRIEELRERETAINNKELILAEREKLLFKKEKELRILERLLKEKIRNAELFMNRCKLIDTKTIDLQNKKNDVLKVEVKNDDLKKYKNDNIDDKIHDKYYHEKMVKKDNAKSLISLGSEKSLDLKNPPNSKSSLITTATAPAASVASVASAAPSTTTTISSSSPKKKLPIAELNVPLKNQQSVYHSQTSFRKKRKQKICYDDLDSTLSADIGDSSFIVTSTKFNPEIFKKPMAFTRSSSERRPKNFLERPLSNIFEDDKVLKRISDNILVSQDESTIFQDYGLIDNHNKKNDNKSTAYLDLDNGSLNKINNKNQKINKKQQCNNKTTTLWNEKSDEWLQKKRQAYNSANQKIPIEDFDTTPINNNKENHSNDFKNDICQKIKTLKGIKKFGIFR